VFFWLHRIAPLFIFGSFLSHIVHFRRKFVSLLFILVAPLFSLVAPLFSLVAPLFSLVAPLFSLVAPKKGGGRSVGFAIRPH